MKPGRFGLLVTIRFSDRRHLSALYPPMIGIADKSRLARLRYPNGLSRTPPEDHDQRFDSFLQNLPSSRTGGWRLLLPASSHRLSAQPGG